MTTREFANAETLEAGKAAAEAVIMAGKDKIAGRKRKRESTSWYDEDAKTKIAKHTLTLGMWNVWCTVYKSTNLHLW